MEKALNSSDERIELCELTFPYPTFIKGELFNNQIDSLEHPELRKYVETYLSKLPIPTMLADIKNAGGGSPSRMLLGMLMARLKHQARVRVGDGDVSAAA